MSVQLSWGTEWRRYNWIANGLRRECYCYCSQGKHYVCWMQVVFIRQSVSMQNCRWHLWLAHQMTVYLVLHSQPFQHNFSCYEQGRESRLAKPEAHARSPNTYKQLLLRLKFWELLILSKTTIGSVFLDTLYLILNK